MRLAALKIENFRSVDALVLNELSNINIFVGKNNSGKSNILKSIDIFMKSLKKQLIVKMYDKRDFYCERTVRPVKIACSLEIKDDIYQEFIRKMMGEYPQLVAGIENMKSLRNINIYTSSISNEDNYYSYIEKITLSNSTPFSLQPPHETNLLHIETSVAHELIQRQTLIREFTTKQKQLEDGLQINSEDFTRLKDRRPSYGRLRGNDIVFDLINSSGDIHEFRNRVREELDNYHQEKERIVNSQTENELEVFSGRTKLIPNHVTWLMEQLEKVVILHESERKSPIEKKDAERLLDLKMKRGGTEQLEQLQNIVANLLNVKVDAFKGDTAEGAEIDVDNFLVDMNGTGIRESLRLILDYEFSKPEILLIEEPEVHLHFELERKMFKYLVNLSNEVQIFMTTHSTAFIDSSEANNIFLVKKNQSTEINPLKNDELSEVINELGINMSSLLLSKVIVFVEGPTDEQIIRAYLEKFHPLLSYSDVGIVRMTGVGNYKYYANVYALEIFNNYGLKTIFILDSDSRTEEEINRIIENHPAPSIIKVLPKRCVENYFLSPAILLKFIQRKMNVAGLRTNIPSEEDVINAKMEQIIDFLYPETVRLFLSWKYLKPIYPSVHFDKKAQLDTVEKVTEWIKDGTKLVEDKLLLSYTAFEESLPNELVQFSKIWTERRYDVVPGDKVIDLLCSEFGIRYNKSKMDIELLTQVVTMKEWPANLNEVLNEIASIIKD